MPDGEMLDAFPNIRNKTGCLFSPLLLNIVQDVVARAIRQGEKKDIQFGKEKVKLFLVTDEMIAHKKF